MTIRSHWRRLMIRAATSQAAMRTMTRAGALFGIGRRFAGRSSVAEAVAFAGELRAQGLHASLFHLGEYARDASVVETTVNQSIEAARALGIAGLDAHVSVDPTSLGYLQGSALGEGNARRIAQSIRTTGSGGLSCLMLDMEDHSMLERTLTLERELAASDLPVGVTLQAYLHRTGNDLSPIMRRSGYVLLVKGAFAEREPLAWEDQHDIDANYLQLAGRMLATEARDSGFYPAFGTHDERLIRQILSLARERRWEPGNYEFEFLYGVRMDLARRLASEGESVRVYLPFGTDWWPYVARRIGENPRYLRNLFSTAATETRVNRHDR